MAATSKTAGRDLLVRLLLRITMAQVGVQRKAILCLERGHFQVL